MISMEKSLLIAFTLGGNYDRIKKQGGIHSDEIAKRMNETMAKYLDPTTVTAKEVEQVMEYLIKLGLFE